MIVEKFLWVSVGIFGDTQVLLLFVGLSQTHSHSSLVLPLQAATQLGGWWGSPPGVKFSCDPCR